MLTNHKDHFAKFVPIMFAFWSLLVLKCPLLLKHFVVTALVSFELAQMHFELVRNLHFHAYVCQGNE